MVRVTRFFLANLFADFGRIHVYPPPKMGGTEDLMGGQQQRHPVLIPPLPLLPLTVLDCCRCSCCCPHLAGWLWWR